MSIDDGGDYNGDCGDDGDGGVDDGSTIKSHSNTISNIVEQWFDERALQSYINHDHKCNWMLED